MRLSYLGYIVDKKMSYTNPHRNEESKLYNVDTRVQQSPQDFLPNRFPINHCDVHYSWTMKVYQDSNAKSSTKSTNAKRLPTYES